MFPGRCLFSCYMEPSTFQANRVCNGRGGQDEECTSVVRNYVQILRLSVLTNAQAWAYHVQSSASSQRPKFREFL